ncbi:MAG TPA: hypothetical protein VGJ07_17150 [Rugosimonospora sp.]
MPIGMDGTRLRGRTQVGIAGVTSRSGAVMHHSDLLALSYALAGALNIRLASLGQGITVAP